MTKIIMAKLCKVPPASLNGLCPFIPQFLPSTVIRASGTSEGNYNNCLLLILVFNCFILNPPNSYLGFPKKKKNVQCAYLKYQGETGEGAGSL